VWTDGKRACNLEISGQRLHQYEVSREAGHGGMGDVYLAEDTRLRRRVAIKVLALEHAASPQRRRRLEREALAASALNHPNALVSLVVCRVVVCRVVVCRVHPPDAAGGSPK
jgi:serine/threonine protein kinase